MALHVGSYIKGRMELKIMNKFINQLFCEKYRLSEPMLMRGVYGKSQTRESQDSTV
jgi:hypothetical protein